jgi:uncharacterized protein YbcC (UPF0753/DUF2309 family)
MTNSLQIKKQNHQENHEIENLSKAAWGKMAPFWPLENLIACNPLQGFENLPFEEALKKAAIYFEQESLPQEIEEINRQTIKWCQAFFDQGQSTIKMPNRHLGFYASWLGLAKFDDKLHQNSADKIKEINSMSLSPKEAIIEFLERLKISKNEQEKFLTLMLTTLPGWASYVKYLGEWKCDDAKNDNTQIDYLAVRLAITLLIWPKAKSLLLWHQNIAPQQKPGIQMLAIDKNEKIYQKDLIEKLLLSTKSKSKKNGRTPDAQFVFCIDVRSEPMRRAIESRGNYETFGFAGFFGIAATIENEITKESYSSCPVLLKPKHKIVEKSSFSELELQKEIERFKKFGIVKKFYQSLKYGFTTPFVLAEAIGVWSSGWMAFHSVAPKSATKVKKKLNNHNGRSSKTVPFFEGLSLEDQLASAKGALATMGLTSNFAPIVVLCGHGSTTENNAYATALDCGACGGRHGGSNAKILAAILNNKEVRKGLEHHSIFIPAQTKFIAAQHNTTTDDIELYAEEKTLDFEKIKLDLKAAQKINSKWRLNKMGHSVSEEESVSYVEKRSVNWAETRPEWGLACNASFIVAKRDLTQNIDLDGRSFLHSYDWQTDEDGSALNLILTAPMVVAQWINSQYLFSTINNVAFGSGSKITQNIVGKIGVMQGNASDLMHGLPLQSVFSKDNEAYHQPLRLTTFVHAPTDLIDKAIYKNEILQKLFGNSWVHVFCLDPRSGKTYSLQRYLKWHEYQ